MTENNAAHEDIPVTNTPSLETRVSQMEAFARFTAERLGVIVNFETGEWKLSPEGESRL